MRQGQIAAREYVRGNSGAPGFLRIPFYGFDVMLRWLWHGSGGAIPPASQKRAREEHSKEHDTKEEAELGAFPVVAGYLDQVGNP